MPPEPEPLSGGDTSARSNGSQAVKIIEPPSVRALREKIGKIQKVIAENEPGKTVNGVTLKKPLVLVAMPAEEKEEESPARVGCASKSTRMTTSHNALRGSVDQRQSQSTVGKQKIMMNFEHTPQKTMGSTS